MRLAYSALWLTPLLLHTSCGTPLSLMRLEHHDDYFMRSPGIKRFSHERLLPGDSWLRGELEIDVTEVHWPVDERGAYRMVGTIRATTRGHIASREAAQEAPRDEVRAAMEPDNIDEVFEEIVSRPGAVVTRVHWDRLESLKLPISFERKAAPSPFTSALRDGAWNWALEIALVWQKALMPFFSVPPFGTYSLTAVDETAEGLTLTVEQDVGGCKPFRYRYHFVRGKSLVGVEAMLRDGSTLKLTSR